MLKTIKMALFRQVRTIAIKPKYVMITLPQCITEVNGKVRVAVEARPNSKKDEIVEVTSEFVRITVQAEPKNGKANDNLIEFLAGAVGVDKDYIELAKGGKSKSKIVLISGASAEKVFTKLKKLCKSFNI